MSVASQHDRSLLVEILTHQRRKEVIQTAFFHYWPAFSTHFIELKTWEPQALKLEYQHAFARLRIELKADHQSFIPRDTDLLTTLLLLGHDRMNLSLPTYWKPETLNYLDSDLLLKMLATETEWIFELFHGSYYSAFRRISTDRLAEEATATAYHDALMKVSDKVINQELQPPMMATFFTYFFKTFRNKAKEMYRAESRFKMEEVLKLQSSSAVEEQPSPEEQLSKIKLSTQAKQPAYWESLIERLSTSKRYDFDSEKEFVHDILGRVNTSCRNLLQLFYLSQYDYASIAREVNLPEKTVKSRLYDCRQQLKKLLNP